MQKQDRKVKKKKVAISRPLSIAEDYVVPASLNAIRASKGSFLMTLTNDILMALEARKAVKVYEVIDGVKVDVTPEPTTACVNIDNFRQLRNAADAYLLSFIEGISFGSLGSSAARLRSMGRLGKISMEDILNDIGSALIDFDSQRNIKITSRESLLETELRALEPTRTTQPLPFIRIILRKTENIVLYSQQSSTTQRDSADGELVLQDNKVYEYLTTGKGKIRRRSDSEAQTAMVLYKSREVNTQRRSPKDVGSYVSYYEMYDTYEELLKSKVTSTLLDETNEILASTQHKMKYTEQCAELVKLPTFKFASMIIKRCLAGNEHEQSQCRFRNMKVLDRMALHLEYRYTVRVLFRYPALTVGKERKAVADISFCHKNGDILAVAYGIYTFSAMTVPRSGQVCVWSIKNPGDPERIYHFNTPAISVEFSPYVPTLLAISLYDGSVEVRDITKMDDVPVAVSQRNTSPGCEPVVAIKWIKQSERNDIDPFLTLSQDGSVTKFRIINSPHLLGYTQMVLERTEGAPEGLVTLSSDLVQQANRHPQGLNLTLHPLLKDVYYVLTDEGCLHYQHQYLEVLKTHDGSVNSMDFSPWSPKLFLTCGNDWTVRIWLDGIFKPLITLQNHLSPIHCAYWSRTHSTIIISINRKSLDIWDIRRSILRPVSSTTVASSYLTVAKFARCGRSIALGNERGNIIMCALDDMPFPPHFQYDELEKAIYKALSTYPDLLIELKSIGFFGYPKKGYMPPT